jgi:hypothetical protein
MSEKKQSLKKSLALFSYEVPTIHKGTKSYGYSYADLSEIFNVIKPLLKKHSLGFTQLINEGNLETEVFHIETEESITSRIPIPEGAQLKGMNEFQTLGSAITYLRRYAISSMLALITDVDNDASGEQTKKSIPKKAQVEITPDKPKPRQDGMLVIPTKKDIDAALYHNMPIEEVVAVFKMDNTQCAKYKQLLTEKTK